MKRTIYSLLLLLLLYSVLSFGQDKNNEIEITYGDRSYYLVDSLDLAQLSESDRQLVDSCLVVYHGSAHDTIKTQAILTIVEECMADKVWPKYNQWAHVFIQEKLASRPSTSVTRSFKSALASVINNIGFYHYSQGDVLLAMEYFNSSLNLFEEIGNKTEMADVYNNIGVIYDQQGDIPLATECYHKGLKLQEEIGNREGMATLYNNIGNIHDRQGDFPLALEYYNKGLKLRKEIGNKSEIANSYNNIGFVYHNRDLDKDFSLALDYYYKSLELNEEIGNIESLAGCYTNIGAVHFEQKDIPSALEYYQKGLEIQIEIGDKIGMASSYINIGNSYRILGDLNAAKKNGLKGIELAQLLGFPEEIKSAAQFLSKVYEKQDKGMLALEMHKLFIAMRDSINNETAQRAVAQQQAKYEYEKQKAIDDAEHDKQIAIEQEEKEQQKIISFSAAGGFILVLLFLIFVHNRYRAIKKQKIIIEKEKDRSENLLLNILPAEIAAELKEKGRADARDFDMVSILFTDFKGFTAASEKLNAQDLVTEINTCFEAFDGIMGKYDIEKIKTIGDAYMAAGGLPVPTEDSVKNTVLAALEMQVFISERKAILDSEGKPAFEMRVGIHTGPVVAGIVGVKKFQYDIWGDTVNTASRMESSGEVTKVNVSQATYELLKDDPQFSFENRGKIEAKGKGEIDMYFVSKT